MAEPREGRGRGAGPQPGRGPAARDDVRGGLPAPTQTGSWLRGIHFSGFSIVMMALLVLAVVVLAPALREYIQQRQQIADAEHTVNGLRSQISEMNAERARWSDPSYIRAEARERLDYVMPGDISYLIIDDRPASEKEAAAAPVSSKIQSTPSDWSASLFGSFMTAGLTDETPAQLAGKGVSTSGGSSKPGGSSTEPSKATPSPTATPSGKGD